MMNRLGKWALKFHSTPILGTGEKHTFFLIIRLDMYHIGLIFKHLYQ